MKQVVQNIRDGSTIVREIPAPLVAPGGVLVATRASLISAGTERYLVELARKSLIEKARQRPDHVRRVLQKLRTEGVLSTAQQVKAKLDEPMSLGYSAAGVVLATGAGVQEFKPGDRVAVAGPHAGVISIGRNLCARIPDGVEFEQAAYAAVGAIGLEGVRLARATLGERVLVIGLGLIGQLCVAMLKAQGCKVFGLDIDPGKLELAKAFGADAVGTGAPLDELKVFSDGRGVDAVVITAATASNQPIELAAEACRVHGRIVLVGVVGLNLPRPPFFKKELEFTVSASLGPGRWDPAYEEKGIDYPLGLVRWTAQRNLEAVLDLIAQGKLPVEKLTSHRFPIERGSEAYELITRPTSDVLGVVLEYPEEAGHPARTVRFDAPAAIGKLGVSVVGAGNFARLMLLPLISRTSGFALRGLCSARGMNAEVAGRRLGFQFASTDVEEVLADKSTQVVFLATRHNLHADQVTRALRAGKHVFVEKPLCITAEELLEIRRCLEALGPGAPILMVGFNRRFAPATRKLKEHFLGVGSLTASFRMAPGEIPPEFWTQDPEEGGGRIIGEACHGVDVVTALHDSPPVRVFAESTARTPGVLTTDDRVFITLRHRNGGLSSISYQSGGDRAGPGERIEVFGGGRTGVVEGWNDVQLWKGNRSVARKGGRDKGHASEVTTFLEACRSGGAWPIPWEHLYGVTLASILAVQSLREGVAFELDEVGA